MPSSTKPRKKMGKSAIERIRHGKFTKQRAHTKAEIALINMRNAMELGHECNRHKIDATFAPIESFLTQQETEGESTVDDKGNVLMWDEKEGAWINVAEGLANMTWMFDLAAGKFGWDAQPDGLKKLGNKLNLGVLLFASDLKAAREAIVWMRDKISGVTPNEWSEVMEIADQLEREGKVR